MTDNRSTNDGPRDQPRIEDLSTGEWLKILTPGQIWKLSGVLFVLLLGSFKLGYEYSQLKQPERAALSLTEEVNPRKYSTSGSTIAQISDSQARPSLTLIASGELGSEASLIVVDDLRKSKNLRSLSIEESGKPLCQSPRGIYCFTTWNPFFKFTGNLSEFTCEVETDWKKDWPDFELHFLADSLLYVVGFSSKSDAIRVGYLDGTTQKSLTVSPCITSFANCVISIPLDRVESCDTRMLTMENGLPVIVIDLNLR